MSAVLGPPPEAAPSLEPPLDDARDGPREEPPSLRLAVAMALAALVATAAAVAGIGVRGSYGAQVTGDEPHYVLTAISLAEDRSLDVADEIAARRYRSFHEARLEPQTRRLEGGRHVSPHDPLLPLLLAIPVSIGGWIGAKLSLASSAGALAALVLWVAVRRFDVPLRAAFLAVLVFSASAPLAVYGSQIYAELPAALAVTVGLAAVTGSLRRGGLIALGGALMALPWLSIKFVPAAGVLGGLGIVRLLRSSRPWAALTLAGGAAVAGAFFLVAHHAWYGGWTPYATGRHFVSGEVSVVGAEPDLLGRSTRLIGLLLDSRFGLAAWQPAWLFAVPALGALVKRRPGHWTALVLVVGAGWLTATFIALTMHGWWWPGRQVVAVLPAAVVAIAWWVGPSRTRLAGVVVAGAVGVASHVWVVAEGLQGRLTWVVDFFATTNPWYRAWRLALPDYVYATTLTWVLHAVWILAIVVLAGWAWWRARERDEEPGFFARSASTTHFSERGRRGG